MNWTLLQNSLIVSAAATALATLFGLLAALAISALERRWRNAALVLVVTALALPPFLVTNCWLHYLGATGAWRSWLPFEIYSLPGAAWLLALQLWPVSALVSWAAWRKLQPSLIEVAPEAQGWRLIRWLLLPLAGKALGFAALLTFVLALNNFAVPAILQVKVLPAEVWVEFSTNLDLLAALRAGWPLVVIPLLALPWLARQEVSWPRRAAPATSRAIRRQLGAGWFAVSLAVLAGLAGLCVALPAVQLVCNGRTWTELPAAVEAGRDAVCNSFAFAALSATLVAAGGVGLGMIGGNPKSEIRNPKEIRSPKSERGDESRRLFGFRASDFFRISDFGFRTFFSWLPFFASGVLLGIALIALFNRPASFWLYRGAGIVVLALVLRYFAIGWNGAAVALRETDPALTDAARLAIQMGWRMLWRIVWPQIAPQIAAVWYVVYLLCLWDVESLVLIVPPGGETLALRIFNLLHYGHNPQVNALCLTLLALALAPLAVVGLWSFSKRIANLPERRPPARPVASELSNFKSEISNQRRAGPEAGAPMGGRLRKGFSMLALVSLAGCGGPEPANEAPLESSIFSKAVVIGGRGVGVGQFNKPRSVAVDAAGNVYAADMTGRVQKFTPDGRYVLAWQIPETKLGKAKGMARDAAGNIIVIEPHYQRVNHFSPDGRLVAQWGVSGTNAGQLKMPRAVAVNSRGELWIAEYGVVERVQRFALAEVTASDVATNTPGRRPALRAEKFLGGFGRYGSEPGEFNRPEGIGVDAQDRLYVADSCNHRIQVFDAEGRFLRAFGKPGAGRGELSYPYDVCVDAAGRVYVCEFGNSRIQVFNAAGEPLEIIGGPGAGPGRFNNPWGVALDSQGNLYVADALNNRVQKLVARTGTAAGAEIRNPKSEIRKKSEARSPNRMATQVGLSAFGFRASFGSRISDFGFPHSPPFSP